MYKTNKMYFFSQKDYHSLYVESEDLACQAGSLLQLPVPKHMQKDWNGEDSPQLHRDITTWPFNLAIKKGSYQSG